MLSLNQHQLIMTLRAERWDRSMAWRISVTQCGTTCTPSHRRRSANKAVNALGVFRPRSATYSGTASQVVWCAALPSTLSWSFIALGCLDACLQAPGANLSYSLSLTGRNRVRFDTRHA